MHIPAIAEIGLSDRVNIQSIASELGFHRNTVAKYLKGVEPDGPSATRKRDLILEKALQQLEDQKEAYEALKGLIEQDPIPGANNQ